MSALPTDMSGLNMLIIAEGFPVFYGTTPPRADAPLERLDSAARRLSERIADLDVDGIVIYDVQEERGRTTVERPFPFLPTYDPRVYGVKLMQTTGKPIVAYKCVAQTPEPQFREWLAETVNDYGIGCVSLVGRATSAGHHEGIGLLDAMRIASETLPGGLVGGVVIPERHGPGRSESARLIAKSQAGCRYFVSQAVYSPDAVIRLCRDYALDCERAGIAPRRIILTFTPCGRPQTLFFMKWLGITVPPAVEAAILAAEQPLQESIRICAANLQQILESGVSEQVPLGINIESVSIAKEEIAGTIALAKALRAVAASPFGW